MRKLLAALTRTRLGLAGTVLTTVSAFAFLGLLGAELVGVHLGPYAGILAFLVMPFLFVVGLLLVALGLWRGRGRAEQVKPDTGRAIRIFVAATLLNLLIVAVATLKGVEVMETNEFCGQTCHKVMEPEHVAFQRSTHARLSCVTCHVGAGVGSFVKAKLSGTRQVVAVLRDSYPTPIPAPVHNLRPASETCETCHSPTRVVGDLLKVFRHFKEDEGNTELKTVMMVRAGAVHWHATHTVRYRSDPTRETVYEIEKVEDSKVTRWRGPEDKPGVWRTMDCTDCHNRQGHMFLPPEEELDRALADGRLDRALPFVRREGLKALKADYPSHEAARSGIRQALIAVYGTSERTDKAAATLGDIHAANVFPQMKVGWNTYKNQLGHVTDMGCLRCHNGDHKTDGGDTLFADCDTCHTTLADSEPDPEILKTLQP